MERYRKIRPIDLEAPPSTISTKPVGGDPLRPRTYIPPSYIRSPVPLAAKTFLQPSTEVQQPREPRRLRVALLGAPNAGKTSLLNQLLNVPVGAVSAKKNTTRESIMGVLTRENFQFEFVDCPGIVPLDGTEESKALSAEAWKNYNDCDCALLVVDTVKKPETEFLKIIRNIAPKQKILDEWREFSDQSSSTRSNSVPVILVLNKSDLVEDRKWLKVRQYQLSGLGDFDKTFFVSAKENRGLDTLVNYLKTRAVPGAWMYPSDAVTTLPKTVQLEQLIRSCLFTWFNKDVPYKIQQQTVGWTERLDGSLVIEHELIVKDSVVARMILGTKNRLLGRLRENVVYKLKQNWNMDNITLLIYVKAETQRKSRRDKIEESKRENSHLYFSRGSG